MIYLLFPREGCLFSEMRELTLEEFQAAWIADEKPAALMIAENWVGEGEYRRPVGVAYDFVIERINREKGANYSCWRELGE